MIPNDVESLLADPDRALAHFTLVADLTTLRETCQLTRSGEMVVVRYDGLPFAALAFLAEDPVSLAELAAQLVGPDEAFYLLLNERQARLAERAFVVETVNPEWQMLFAGDPAALDPGDAVPLGAENIGQMQELAADAGLTALEADPLRYGPAFGVWNHERLVAMGGTHLRIPGSAEIGNIATRSTHRRRGYARQTVAALVQAHIAEGRRVFLMVFQSNRPAVRLYESLGFERHRPMFLMRCRLPAK